MMAMEFADELLRMIRVDQRVRARSFHEARYAPCPYGVQVRLPTGALVFLQTVTAPPTGTVSRPDTGEPAPVSEPMELPEEGPTELADVERWLARLITTDRSPRIEEVRLFQNRRGRAAIPHGLHLRLHSGGQAWIYVRRSGLRY
ncbi:hypothetical protein ACFPC0_10905 [Streptomyces andamanensis]|uniref:Uncharacterized protein n=1 Tax=Streptomyces andamanensis TaxID=1565035 RepID=A0ABV8TCJ1_9ACTN